MTRNRSDKDRPRRIGEARRAAFRSLRETLAPHMAELLRGDPAALDSAVELGLVRREWLDDPTQEPVSLTPPREIVRRFLERQVERRPSTLSKLGLSAIQILSSPQTDDVEGEPTPLGVVFSDLSGFTAFTASKGDETASRVITANARVAGSIVRARGGRIVKHIGDGFLLSFSTPEGTVLGALELVHTIREPLPMRAGAHWGEPLVTRDNLIGHDVNVAARVTDVAKGGDVVVTAALRDAAGQLGGVRFGRLADRSIRGVAEPVRVCRAQWESAPA